MTKVAIFSRKLLPFAKDLAKNLGADTVTGFSFCRHTLFDCRFVLMRKVFLVFHHCAKSTTAHHPPPLVLSHRLFTYKKVSVYLKYPSLSSIFKSAVSIRLYQYMSTYSFFPSTSTIPSFYRVHLYSKHQYTLVIY